MVLLANSALSVSSESVAKESTRLSAGSILQGINAVEVGCLPLIWQQIADGKATVGHSDPDFLVALARLFYTKATDLSPEVFQQEGISQKSSQQNADFPSFYTNGASET